MARTVIFDVVFPVQFPTEGVVLITLGVILLGLVFLLVRKIRLPTRK
jgi:hypothetical protein